MAKYQQDNTFTEHLAALSVKLKEQARVVGMAEAGVLCYKAGLEAAGDLIMARVKELEDQEQSTTRKV